MRTYLHDASSWRDYQPFLPADIRLTPDTLPTESRWPFRGLSVHVDRYEAAASAPTVIVCHGGGSYGRLLAPLVRFLAAYGYRVLLPDLPGYGLTEVPPAEMRYPLWVETVAGLALEEKARTGQPVVLVGMSMGGLLTVHAAGLAPPGTVAAIVTTTLIDPRDPDMLAAITRLPGARHLVPLMALAKGLRVPVRHLANVRAMSSVPAINALSMRDPCGGGNRVPLGFFQSWLDYAPRIAHAQFDRCPVLLAHPGADRWTPTALSRRVLGRFASRTQFVELPNCQHLPIESPGLAQFRDSTLAFLGVP